MRYQRQIQLQGFGQAAQDKLAKARILVVGAGGLGCPALQYLAAAGLGCIGICDFDRVDISNLHRQILFHTEDIGKAKAWVAAERLQAMNPSLQVLVFDCPLTQKNAWELLSDFDLVLDASDNFATRYLLNDACVLLNKPLIYGAVSRFEGQVAVFNYGDEPRSNYRDLLPLPPPAGSVLDCNQSGVLGVLTGIIGCMQAAEAIKMITGIGEVLANRLLHYNLLTQQQYDMYIDKNAENCLAPQSKTAFEHFDYAYFCGDAAPVFELSGADFGQWIAAQKGSIIDLREAHEMPIDTGFYCIKIPFSSFEKALSNLDLQAPMLLFCQSGKRSRLAVELLKKQQPTAMAYSSALQWLTTTDYTQKI